MPDRQTKPQHAESLFQLLGLYSPENRLGWKALVGALSLRLGFVSYDDNDDPSNRSPTHFMTIDTHAITAQGAMRVLDDVASRAGFGGMLIVDIKLRGLSGHVDEYISTDLTERVFRMLYTLNMRILASERGADIALSAKLAAAKEAADRFLHDPLAVLDADDLLGTRSSAPKPFPCVYFEQVKHESDRRREHKARCRAWWYGQ